MASAAADERCLVRIGEIAARGHEKRAAAHRGIDHAEMKDSIGRCIADERPQRAANQVLGERLRGVKRAGRLSNTRSGFEGNRHVAGRTVSSLDPWLVIEQRFVNGAQLLDTKVAVGDRFPPGAIGRGTCRQRQHGASGRVVVEIATLGQRRASRGEQPPVERRHPETARTAAAMREPRDGLQGVPKTDGSRPGPTTFVHSRWRAGDSAAPRCVRASKRRQTARWPIAGRPLGERTQRLEAVTLTVNGMPERHQTSCLGEQQKEHSVDDRQRLLERISKRRGGTTHVRADERAKDIGRGRQHSVLERSADTRRVTL